MQQAIVTKVLPPTDYKGKRIKATCSRGSITLVWHNPPISTGEPEDGWNHRGAVESLIFRFVEEDVKEFGPGARVGNPWNKPFISGVLPNGDWCHVFVEKE